MSCSWRGGFRKTEGGRMRRGQAETPPFARRVVLRAWLVCFVLAGLLLVLPRSANQPRMSCPAIPGWFHAAAPDVKKSVPGINSHTAAAREDVPEEVRWLNLSRALLSRDCSIVFLPNLYGISALDTRTGVILRHFGGIEGGLALADDGALVSGADKYCGDITGFDPVTGVKVWQRDERDDISDPAAGPGPLVAVSAAKKGLFAIDARDGRTIWHAEIPGIQRPAVGDDGTVYVSWCQKADDSRIASVFCACDGRTGRLRWKRGFDGFSRWPRLAPNGDPVFSTSSTKQPSIYILSASDGSVLKRFHRVAQPGDLDVGPDRVIYLIEQIAGDGYYLRSVNPQNGKLQWRTGEKDFYFRRCAFGLPGFVYAAGYLVHRDVNDPKYREQHCLRALDSKTGKTLWSFTGSHDPRISLFDPLVGPDGTVYVGFRNYEHAGYVYALDGRTGKVKWERDLQS